MGVTRTVQYIAYRGESQIQYISVYDVGVYTAANACTGDCKILRFIYPRRAHTESKRTQQQVTFSSRSNFCAL
jgi:hypothetical protein